MQKPDMENVESYYRAVAHSEEIFMNVLFTQGPYWFSWKSSGHQMFLTQTSSSRVLLISHIKADEAKITGPACRLLFAKNLDLVAAMGKNSTGKQPLLIRH